MFVDKVKITVKGGDGGNGCISFRREKYVPKGGPNGGDGGDGGNVILQADSSEQSLLNLMYNRNYAAGRGEHGRGSDQYGKRGADVILKVPIGTIVKDVDNNNEIIFDLDENGKTFIAAKGGKGGWGNIHFATSTNRAPRRCEPGTKGEIRNYELELKIIADIGLVGYPNAGKSTILGAISAAKPKTAPYPFTTRYPVVGMIEFDDFFRMYVADIPGLVDGAHDNIGLGHSFLRHIERTKILAYVLDMAGVDGRKPYDDYVALRKELELYKEGLSLRPSIIIANKMDLPEAKENMQEFLKQVYEVEIIEISATELSNIDKLLPTLRFKVQKIRDAEK